MKTAAKVFIIIAMITEFWLIFPLILGIVALNKMKYEKPSTAFSICILLFCSMLGGIFLLLSEPSEYQNQ